MENKSRFQLIYLTALSLVLAVSGAVCLYFTISFDYDDSIGHFAVNSQFAPVLYSILAASLVVSAVVWILLRKQTNPALPLPAGLFTVFASMLAGLLVFASNALEAKDLIADMTGAYTTPVDNLPLYVASWAFSLLAAVSLFMNVGGVKLRSSTLYAVFTLFPPLYCASAVLKLYFDESVAINSPVKIINQVMYIVFMLLLTAEAGLSIERRKILPRYAFIGTLAVSVGGTAAIAECVAAFTDKKELGLTLIACCAAGALWLYALARMFSLVNIQKNKREAETDTHAASAAEETTEPAALSDETFLPDLDAVKDDAPEALPFVAIIPDAEVLSDFESPAEITEDTEIYEEYETDPDVSLTAETEEPMEIDDPHRPRSHDPAYTSHLEKIESDSWTVSETVSPSSEASANANSNQFVELKEEIKKDAPKKNMEEIHMNFERKVQDDDFRFDNPEN